MFFGLWKKENFKNEIIDYSGILVGSAICGAGFSLFLIPYNAIIAIGDFVIVSEEDLI